MKSPQATPEAGVKEIETNVQEEIWKFIAATLKRGLRRLLQNLLEDAVYLTINGGGQEVRLELPQRTAGYCAELHQELVSLLGEDGLVVQRKTEVEQDS